LNPFRGDCFRDIEMNFSILHSRSPIVVSWTNEYITFSIDISQGRKSIFAFASAGVALLAALIFAAWAVENLDIAFAPVVGDDVAITSRNQPVSINVVMNDADPVGILNLQSVKIEKAPGHGRVTSTSDSGVVAYSPDADYVGRDAFTYTVAGHTGVRSRQATVKVTVE
jgi:hypothetical protein